MRTPSQTPAQYIAKRRAEARKRGYCTYCFIRKQTKAVRVITFNGPRVKKSQTCDHCRQIKADARQRRESGTVYKSTPRPASRTNVGADGASISRIRREEARKRGDCIVCTTKPADLDYATCSQCRETKAARVEKARDAKKCVTCLVNRAGKNHATCLRCRERMRQNNTAATEQLVGV